MLRIEPSVKRKYFGDPLRVRQILLNLIGNATKFTTRGHILVEILVSASDNEDHIILNITDTGIGIPEEELGSIFYEFSQATSHTPYHKGTGLGLAISSENS